MNEHDDNLQVPAKFAEAMQRLQKERVFVPAQVDERILSEAQRYILKQKSRIVVFPRWIAVAASIAAMGMVVFFFSQSSSPTYAAEDMNRDGTVDILDALELARRVEAGEAPAADFNHDGVVDGRDAEALATKVVRLEKGGRS